MIKSGLIFGVVALVLVMGSTLISPLCSPCVAILIGLAAGYVGGIFDKPPLSGDSVKVGAVAGAVAGIFGVVGGLIAGILNALFIAPSGNEAFNRLFGLPPTAPETIWLAQIGLACCIGLINVGIMAALGAGGGAIWYQIVGKKRASETLPVN